jgi:hypothetical protein
MSSDIDDFINEVILGNTPKNIWDDVWMIKERDETTPESGISSAEGQ